MSVEPTARWWAPVGAPVCGTPGRAVRRDEVLRPRIRTLAEVLAEAPVETPPPDTGSSSDPRPARSGLPDPPAFAAARATAVRVVGAVAETAAGRRPAHHLATICDDATRDAVVSGLRPLAGASTRAGPVRVEGVSATAVEVAATLHGPTRSRALAVRLERDPDGPAWRVRLLALL